jgi:hypothetical protein
LETVYTIFKENDMKKIIMVLALFLVLVGCSLPHFITFDEVSNPYLIKYDMPEKIIQIDTNYSSLNNREVKWIWLSQGFEVDFQQNGSSGWAVIEEKSFTPIITPITK